MPSLARATPGEHHDDQAPVTGSSLKGRIVLVSGASRGIGHAIAMAAAERGAKLVLLAKTDKANPSLPGTVFSAAEEIRRIGAEVLPLVTDIRDEQAVVAAVQQVHAEFGGIDVVINNAAAVAMLPSARMSLKRFDLLMQINVRGAWAVTTTALPMLLQAPDARILSISPPLTLTPAALGAYPGYMVSKYAATLMTLGWAHEFLGQLSATCLWPGAPVATSGVASIFGPDDLAAARSSRIMGDAAMALIESPAGEVTGRCFVDEHLLRARGVDVGAYGGHAAHFPRDVFLP